MAALLSPSVGNSIDVNWRDVPWRSDARGANRNVRHLQESNPSVVDSADHHGLTRRAHTYLPASLVAQI